MMTHIYDGPGKAGVRNTYRWVVIDVIAIWTYLPC